MTADLWIENVPWKLRCGNAHKSELECTEEKQKLSASPYKCSWVAQKVLNFGTLSCCCSVRVDVWTLNHPSWRTSLTFLVKLSCDFDLGTILHCCQHIWNFVVPTTVTMHYWDSVMYTRILSLGSTFRQIRELCLQKKSTVYSDKVVTKNV